MGTAMQGNLVVPEEYQKMIDAGVDPDNHEDEKSTVVQQKTAPLAPTYLGGRRFDSQDEALAYASELQSKVDFHEHEKKMNALSPAMSQANKVKPSDILYTDPDAFYQITKEDAKNEILAEINNNKKEEKLWNSFYQKYPDLKDSELSGMLEYQFNTKKSQLGHLPAEQMLDTIGKDVRILLNKVRGKPEGGRELPSAAAVVASASNNSPSAKATEKSEPPQDMASQIRRFQKRGR